MHGRFHNQLCVVTGAASGIGRAVALRLASEGARVLALDLDAGGLERLVADADQPVDAQAVDITDAVALGALSDALSRADVLVNVAGIMDGFLPAGEVDDATWDRVLAVNLTAPMRLSRAVLGGMAARRRGAIVNVASEAGLKGGCAGAAYTASKHGLIGLTKNTAFLYATKGVRANAVAPGPVATGLQPDFLSALAAERIPALLQASITSLAQPEQLASCILWLASDEASNVNGAILASDGGWSAA